MSLQPQQLVSLSDRQGRDLGRVVIERIEGDLVFGRFLPGSDYPAVESLFADYVAAANDQLLSVVGELDEAIAGLGLHLRSAEAVDLPNVHDVQVGAGGINFRTRPAEGNARQPERAPATLPADAVRPDPRTV